MRKLSTCLTVVMLSFSTAFAQNSQTTQKSQTAKTAQISNISNPVFGRPITLPSIIPAPISIELKKGTILLGKSVVLVVTPGTGSETVDLIRKILTLTGVETIGTAKKLPAILDRPYILLGAGDIPVLRSALSRSGALLDTAAEGYTITTEVIGEGALITLAGRDADGLFHALQTFRQLAKAQFIPALVIQDHPTMPIRGTIEGFYGKPWSMEDRTKHLNFLASVKANTYVYSPKDDPYARDRWREDYPATVLNELGKLVKTARQNHVNFVYAISPGPSICFSDPADFKALERKFEALRKIGVHSFYVALDDIEYAKWNCDLDKTTFGASGPEAAGVAQSQLLNKLQASINAKDPGAPALIMVPTEYYDAKESPYKAALRKNLNPRIVVQWTGTDVVPPAISIGDAKAAT
ncbi:MAG: beta-N-acetylglucosaminidase, partial [Pedobacter sp.]